jgi:hypothetical protein
LAFPDTLHVKVKPPSIKKGGPTAAAVIAGKTQTPTSSGNASPEPQSVPWIQPLSYIPPPIEPFILQLALSTRQPKYVGPFNPFKENDVLYNVGINKPGLPEGVAFF